MTLSIRVECGEIERKTFLKKRKKASFLKGGRNLMFDGNLQSHGR